MVEIGWKEHGYPIETEPIRLDIYRLMGCFGGSKLLMESGQSDNKWLSQFFWGLTKDNELSEISRLLVSIAVISRNCMDHDGWQEVKMPGLPDNVVGTFCSDIENEASEEPLIFREACNKVIHGNNINFEANQDTDYKTQYLLPTIYLYGEKQGTNWKATLDIPKFLFWADRNSGF